MWKAWFDSTFTKYYTYLSISGNETEEDDKYLEFKHLEASSAQSEINAILFCVGRCREGSDIKNLDMGVYLDHVKNRGILVCIQTVGRILRPDVKKLKSCGFIIDTFINDGKIEIEIMTAQKIISYYEKVLGLTSDESSDELLENYQKMKEFLNDTTYDEKSKKIKIKVDDDSKHDTEIKLELITKNFDWSKFKIKLDTIIDKKFGVSEEESLNIKYQLLKEKVQKQEIETKSDYKSFAKLNSLELEPEKKFFNYGWVNYYDFLGLNIDNYPSSLDGLKKICRDKKIDTEKKYLDNCDKYDLPVMPEEIYKNFTTFYNFFNEIFNKSIPNRR